MLSPRAASSEDVRYLDRWLPWFERDEVRMLEGGWRPRNACGYHLWCWKPFGVLVIWYTKQTCGTMSLTQSIFRNLQIISNLSINPAIYIYHPCISYQNDSKFFGFRDLSPWNEATSRTVGWEIGPSLSACINRPCYPEKPYSGIPGERGWTVSERGCEKRWCLGPNSVV